MTTNRPILKNPCWNCGGEQVGPPMFCEHCGIIQPPAAMDHFTRLCVPRNFVIDIKLLDARYFALQKQLHPDRFAGKAERERTLSLLQSTAVNEAYQTLKTPVKRAEYVLELFGAPLPPDDETDIGHPDLLMEMMDLRESLEEAQGPTEMEQAVEAVERKVRQSLARLADAFKNGNIAGAQEQTLRLRYLIKALEQGKRGVAERIKKAS